MPHTILSDRSRIRITGPDAENLLHNVMTCDIHRITEDTAQVAALLTPQGKVMFHLLLERDGADGFIADIGADHAAAFIQRMMMYRLRAKVEFHESDESLVAVCWGTDSAPSSDFKRDLRFGGMPVWRGPADEMRADADTASITAHDGLRIAHGVPEPGRDFALGDVFGHDISLDQNGGLDFKKGCYVGQEVVSRMQHRGTARRRVVIVSGDGLAQGAPLMAGELVAGEVGTVADGAGLAIARLDRLKSAMDSGGAITVNGKPVSVALPPAVRYSWPQDTNDG